jgi:hypothetical protein
MSSIKLQPNKYDSEGKETDNPTSQQIVIGIRSLLDKELLIKGDKLTLKYKISSPYDISNVKANLIDNSIMADYWLELSTDKKDQLLAPNYTTGEIYEGELTFNITESMKRGTAIQLFAFYTDTPEDVSIEFQQD